MKKVIYLLVAVMLLLAVLSGCGTTTSSTSTTTSTTQSTQVVATEAPKVQDVTLKMTHWDPGTKDVLDTINNAFINENPGVKFEIDVLPGDQYEKVLRTRFMSGEGPDVYMYYGAKVATLAKDGFMGDITNEDFVSNINPGFIPTSSYDGKLYAVPLNANSYGVFYSKKVFADLGITEFPKTYADFLTLCEKIKAKGIAPIALGAKDLWNAGYLPDFLYFNYVASKGDFSKDLFDGKTTFATSEWKTVLEKFKELVDKGYINKGALGVTANESCQMLLDNKAAMMPNGGWMFGYYTANTPDKIGDIGYFAMPDDSGSGIMGALVDRSLAYNPKSSNIAIDKKYLAFWTKAEMDKAYSDQTASLPCIKGVDPKLPDALKAMAADLGKAKEVDAFSGQWWPTAVADVYQKGIASIAAGEKNTDKILQDLDKAYQTSKAQAVQPKFK